MLELLHDWDSLQSMKVRMCLYEKGLAWKSRIIALTRFEHLAPAYLAINPQGLVPALVDGEHVITESSIIDEYLDDAYPIPALRPSDPLGRARMRAWARYQDEVVHPAVRPATFQLMIKPRFAAMSRDEVEHLVAGHPRPDRAAAYRDWATGEVDVEAVRAAIERMRGIVSRMEATLTRSLWLAGEDLSLADIAMASFVDRVESLRLQRLWSERPMVQRWIAALKARPAYTQSLPVAEGRLPVPPPEILARVLQA